MNGTIDGSGAMMGGVGWGVFPLVILLVLGLAAFITYLFFKAKR